MTTEAAPSPHLQAFRRTLRQSRNRSSTGHTAEFPGQDEPLHQAQGSVEEEQQESCWDSSSQAGEVAAQVTPGGELQDDSDGGSSTASLAGMRAFVAQMQRKYGIVGAAEEAGSTDTEAGKPDGAVPAAAGSTQERQGSLVHLLEAQLAQQAADLGALSDEEEEPSCWGAPPALAKACAAARLAGGRRRGAVAAAEGGASDS